MSVDKELIKKTAYLAKLDIDEKDIASYTENFSNILNFIEQINQADTDNVQPMAHSIDVTQRLREDEVTETNQRDEMQKNAKFVNNGLYTVTNFMKDN